jgi:hypothetical protein
VTTLRSPLRWRPQIAVGTDPDLHVSLVPQGYDRWVDPLDLLADRRRKALALNDDVVQRLTAALLALDLDRAEESRQHVEAALKASKQIVGDLIRGSDEEARLGPGELTSRPEG